MTKTSVLKGVNQSSKDRSLVMAELYQQLNEEIAKLKNLAGDFSPAGQSKFLSQINTIKAIKREIIRLENRDN